jgi:hypothetical protein
MSARRAQIAQLLQEYNLPTPAETSDGPQIISEHFFQQLLHAPGELEVKRLVEERAALLHAAVRWNSQARTGARQPKSKDQTAKPVAFSRARPDSAAEFAASVRGV